MSSAGRGTCPVLPRGSQHSQHPHLHRRWDGTRMQGPMRLDQLPPPPSAAPRLCSCSDGVLLQVSGNLQVDITMVTVIIVENCCHYYRGRVKPNRNYQFFCF